jgi:hypothetical protein
VPSDFVVTMCHDEQDTAGSALDGWTMHAQPPRRGQSFGPGLLSLICKAAECKLFEERSLTPACCETALQSLGRDQLPSTVLWHNNKQILFDDLRAHR